MTPSLDKLISDLERLDKEATPIEWTVDKKYTSSGAPLIHNYGQEVALVKNYNDDNAELIVTLRNNLDKFIAALHIVENAEKALFEMYDIDPESGDMIFDPHITRETYVELFEVLSDFSALRAFHEIEKD